MPQAPARAPSPAAAAAPTAAAIPVTPTAAGGAPVTEGITLEQQQVLQQYGIDVAVGTMELTLEQQQELQALRTPQLRGTATTESGLECEIWIQPIEEKYSVLCPKGYEHFNKVYPETFSSYEDAEYYIVNTISARQAAAVEQRAYSTGYRANGIPQNGAFPGQNGDSSQDTTPPPPRGRFI